MPKYLNRENGSIGSVPILILLAAIGLLGFLLISNTFNFKDRLFARLFPKPPSEAKQDIPPGIAKLPPNNPARGLVYDGLEIDATGECKGLLKIKSTTPALGIRALCTHGPDPAPEGVDITTATAPPPVNTQGTSLKVECDGDGVTGYRVQVVYARSSDVPDRYNTYLASFKQWTKDVDTIFNTSAIETGGIRHVRFVHDANCEPIIANVVMSESGDDSWSNTIQNLQNQGYNSKDRKYMIFVDLKAIKNDKEIVYCGIGNIYDDDQPGNNNANNRGILYGRTDVGCWGGFIPAHELMHNMGGVQLSAPHTSGGFHCVDEYDTMCYSDRPNYPIMQITCTDTTHNSRFDCNHDDYFHTNPPAGSYLATHWNTANNRFLISTSSPAPTASPTTTPTSIPTPTPTPTPSSVDKTLPTVSITSPLNNASVSGTVTIAVTAADNVGVTNTGWILDGANKSNDQTPPYTFSWNTTSYANGNHTISARARDAAGNIGTSALVTVTINN